jgi:lipid A 4'-phosphatase
VRDPDDVSDDGIMHRDTAVVARTDAAEIDRPGPPRPPAVQRNGLSVARISLIVLIVLGIATGVVFALDPGLDLKAASYFLDIAGGSETSLPLSAKEFVRAAGVLVTVAVITPALITVAVKLFRPRGPAPMSSRPALFLILTLILGPGLLVNTMLKEGWARSRPSMVTEFGGTDPFTPWWDPRGVCDSNCSFVSGETSQAVWLAAPAMLAPPYWRYVAFGATAIYACIVAFMRMVAGGHFLSDVLFAAILTGLVIWGGHGLIFRWSAGVTNEMIDRYFERIGGAIARPFAALPRWRGGRSGKPSPPA